MYYSKFEKLEHGFVQPGDVEFQGSEDLSLVQVVAKLFDDISKGKGLQRNFGRNSSKHDPFYAFSAEIQKLPYNLTGLLNNILPGADPGILTDEDKIYRVARKDSSYELTVEYDDPGSFARILALVPWFTIKDLPVWATHDLEQIRKRNILKTYSDAMEFAEELEKINDAKKIPGLKKLIIDFEENNANFLDGTSNFQSINDKIIPLAAMIRDYISPKEFTLLNTLINLQDYEGYSSVSHRKHDFTQKTVSPILKNLKSAKSVDDAFTLSFFGQIREDIRFITQKINPTIIAAGIAIPIALAAGYLISIGLNKALHYADLHRSYTVETAEIPSFQGLADIQGYGLQASQVIIPATQLYNYDPESREFSERELLAQIITRANAAVERGKLLQPLYHDPELQRAIELIASGGDKVNSAFSHGYYPHEKCETKSSGGTPTVECSCDYAINTFSKDQAQVDEGVRQIYEGLSILVNGQKFSDLSLSVIDRSAYSNSDMTLIRDYISAVAGRDGLNSRLESLWTGIAGYPDSETDINYACVSTSWTPEGYGDEIYSMTGNVSYITDISRMLDASVASFEGKTADFQRADGIDRQKRVAGDFGTDQVRALGLGWLGYVYQSEIDLWTKGIFYAATALAFAGSMWAYHEYGDSLFAHTRKEFSLN